MSVLTRPQHRVVVTGLGMISALACDVPQNWQHILAGKSGIRAIDEFDASTYSTRIWAAIKDFDPSAHITPKDCRKMDKFIQFGIVAAAEAMKDSGFEVNESNSHRCGVAVGSGIGGVHTISHNDHLLRTTSPRKISPFFIPASIINMVAGHLSLRHQLRGPNISIVTACTTGTHNIGHAARMIAYGDADMMLAGGSELITTPLCLAGFAAARALSKRNDEPEKASRPWDKDRDGFVLGEGAGILVLESYESAKKRGATIYAELTGFGMSADAFHMTAPDEHARGARLALENALRDARLNPEDIDYINAHGTSTKLNDAMETKAIKHIFGEHAYALNVSSTKSMTGHLLGAAGAIEAIFAILALRDQVVPPTINLDEPDEGFDLNYTAHLPQERSIRVAMSNSFGFGGTNGCLVFKTL